MSTIINPAFGKRGNRLLCRVDITGAKLAFGTKNPLVAKTLNAIAAEDTVQRSI